jgi:putative DNA primase/helicase
VNDAAMQNLNAWVPALLPAARAYLDGYRVSSRDLGRELEEDLSILPKGIVDWGLNDMGDAREGRRTPIDLVLEWNASTKKPAEALHWLAGQLNVELERPRAPRRNKRSERAPPRSGRQRAARGRAACRWR